MTIDRESILEKKSKLQQAIRVLKDLAVRPVLEFEKNEVELGAAMHYLTIGIESILDIGSHLLTEDFGVSPKTYEEVIQLLGEKQIISGELAKKSQGMGKFRNKMIHEYVDLNIQKVYSYLQAAPSELEEFDQAFSKYLKIEKT